MRKIIEAVSINEVSRLDLTNQNKKKYDYVVNNLNLVKDKIDREISNTLILRWIKGKNWEGGLGNGKDVEKMCDDVMSKYNLGADDLGDRFDKLMDFWDSKFEKEGIA